MPTYKIQVQSYTNYDKVIHFTSVIYHIQVQKDNIQTCTQDAHVMDEDS